MGPIADPLSLSLRKGRDRGYVIKAYISIENILLELAHELASGRGLSLPLPRRTYAPKLQNWKTWRPSMIIGRSAQGWIVLPMATFGGTAPDTWDLLLREIVVPVGTLAEHDPAFRDAFFAQTTPPWRHGDGRPTYLVLQQMTIPFTAEVKRVRSRASVQCVSRLEQLTRDRSALLNRSYSVPEVEACLQSYAARMERLYPGITRRSTAQDASVAQDDSEAQAETSGLSAAMEDFVPRWLLTDDDVLSFQYLATDNGDGTSLLTLSSIIESSRLQYRSQPLRPAAAANRTDVQRSISTSSALKLTAPAAHEADKENVQVAPP